MRANTAHFNYVTNHCLTREPNDNCIFFRKWNFINMFERQSVHHTKDFKSIPIPDKCTTNKLTISKSYFVITQNFKNSACRQYSRLISFNNYSCISIQFPNFKPWAFCCDNMIWYTKQATKLLPLHMNTKFTIWNCLK